MTSRVKERTALSHRGKTFKLALAIDDSLPGEAWRVSVAGDRASVKAGKMSGFFIGVGTLLRSIEWKGDTFAIDDFEKSGCPAKPIRCAYYARHFYAHVSPPRTKK